MAEVTLLVCYLFGLVVCFLAPLPWFSLVITCGHSYFINIAVYYIYNKIIFCTIHFVIVAFKLGLTSPYMVHLYTSYEKRTQTKHGSGPREAIPAQMACITVHTYVPEWHHQKESILSV